MQSSPMTFAKDKGQEVNVQVLLRCRPPNAEESRNGVPQVITCNDARREVSVYRNIAGKQSDRTFTFDKVFGPKSHQKDLYNQAITPIVNEVLEGFNCTIFAYGQTGTGKTYTMGSAYEGPGSKPQDGNLPPDAGVIPRSVRQIFDTLEKAAAEYSVKVTFLELYNEELTDLLAPPEDVLKAGEKEKKPLALMEDGRGGVIVRGLEEEIVGNAAEIFTLLARGSARRHTAHTLLNSTSSRSHSIFTITIHVKEATPDGEDLIKCGKLNLVDLAGSENISRSGAREGRAREAGEINKSLLTLGRCITALVEHSGHVPYRDSKLTRLLRDSLGGRTKTCIIATISPSIQCLEETLSTLDYANRAKSIKNKPEVNQKMTKPALIKDMAQEIERLKLDLHAQREKVGVWIATEKYSAECAERKAMSKRIEYLDEVVEDKVKLVEDLQEDAEAQRRAHKELQEKQEAMQRILEETEKDLSRTREGLQAAQYAVREREYIIARQKQTEAALMLNLSDIRLELENAARDVTGLFAKLERKGQIEAANRVAGQKLASAVTQQVGNLQHTVGEAVDGQKGHTERVGALLSALLSRKEEDAALLARQVAGLRDALGATTERAVRAAQAHKESVLAALQAFGGQDSAHTGALEEVVNAAVTGAQSSLEQLEASLAQQEGTMGSFMEQQRQVAAEGLKSAKEVATGVQLAMEELTREASNSSARITAANTDQERNLSQFVESYKEESELEMKDLLGDIVSDIASKLERAHTQRTAKIVEHVEFVRDGAEQSSRYLAKALDYIGRSATGARAAASAFLAKSERAAGDCNRDISAQQAQATEVLQQCKAQSSRSRSDWANMQHGVATLASANSATLHSSISEQVAAATQFGSQLEEEKDAGRKLAEGEHLAIAESLTGALEEDRARVAEVQAALAAVASMAEEFHARHTNALAEISVRAGRYVDTELLVDSSTASTPQKRAIGVPHESAIKRLRTASFDDMAKDFRGQRASGKEGGVGGCELSDLTNLVDARGE